MKHLEQIESVITGALWVVAATIVSGFVIVMYEIWSRHLK